VGLAWSWLRWGHASSTLPIHPRAAGAGGCLMRAGVALQPVTPAGMRVQVDEGMLEVNGAADDACVRVACVWGMACVWVPLFQEKESIAPERQRFLFGGQLLPDSQTLAGAKVPAESVVQIMVRDV